MKILVARTDRLGDVILSTPVAKTLKRDIPDCRVVFLVRPGFRDLLCEDPNIDDVLVDDRDGRHKGAAGFLSLAGEARAAGFDASIVLFAEPRAAFLPLFGRIPLRVGPLSRVYSPLCFNRPIRQRRSLSMKNEAEYNLDLLTPLGCNPTPEPARVYLKPEFVERMKAKTKSLEIPGGTKKIVLHPGSGGSGKDWSEDFYLRLADLLVEELGAYVLLTGTNGEKVVCDRILGGMKKRTRAMSLCGRFSLGELAAFFSQSDLFIGPSTGPLHLASAVGTPVIGLYSPVRVQGPGRWGPMGQGAKITLVPPVECPQRYSCTQDCPHYDCAALIAPKDVAAAARELM